MRFLQKKQYKHKLYNSYYDPTKCAIIRREINPITKKFKRKITQESPIINTLNTLVDGGGDRN